MDPKIYQTVRDTLSERRRKAQAIADEHRFEVYSVIPQIKQFDTEMLYLTRTIVGAGDKAYEKLDKIESLTKRRASLLREHGYPEDYTTPPYECKICNDTGYAGTQMCSCMKKMIQLEALKLSGLGKLADIQSFDNFSLDYYVGASRQFADRAYRMLHAFASGFNGKTSENFLLIGGTGLGKTHLSTAVAKAVIDKGFDVVYVSVVRMFEDFERKRFAPYSYENDHLTDRYFDCDLLIVDDLGSELGTQFTVSALYSLVNTRLNEGKPMIISTNLAPDEFQSRYDQRITSRILGNMTVLLFKGDDIRQIKLRKN